MHLSPFNSPACEKGEGNGEEDVENASIKRIKLLMVFYSATGERRVEVQFSSDLGSPKGTRVSQGSSPCR